FPPVRRRARLSDQNRPDRGCRAPVPVHALRSQGARGPAAHRAKAGRVMLAGSEGRRRVLLVVSAYRPAMIADMQRARLLAWDLPQLGWDVEVVVPRGAEVRPDVIEPEPAGFFAPGTPVHEAGSLPRGLLEAIGARNHGWRTLLPMLAHGTKLLRARRFDLVLF